MSRTRLTYLLGLLASAALLGAALYLQYVQGLEPCPLCIIQRVLMATLAVILLVALIHDPRRSRGRRVYGGLVALVAGAGVAVSGRHVWLQSLPADRVPECGPGLEFMLQNFPLQQVVDMVLRGSGECAETVWTFLGLSIPGWTMIAFSAFLIVGVVYLVVPPLSR